MLIDLCDSFVPLLPLLRRWLLEHWKSMSLKGIRVTPVVVALVPRRPVAVQDSNRANTEPNNGTSKPQDEQASEGEGECVLWCCGTSAFQE
jgi:hypothetical protein